MKSYIFVLLVALTGYAVAMQDNLSVSKTIINLPDQHKIDFYAVNSRKGYVEIVRFDNEPCYTIRMNKNQDFHTVNDEQAMKFIGHLEQVLREEEQTIKNIPLHKGN